MPSEFADFLHAMPEPDMPPRVNRGLCSSPRHARHRETRDARLLAKQVGEHLTWALEPHAPDARPGPRFSRSARDHRAPANRGPPRSGSLSGPASHPPRDAGPDAHPEDTMDGTGPGVIRGIERVTGETFNAETGQWTRDGYDLLEVRIRRGTTIDGAVVALCPDADGTVTADVCIDGPPAP